VLLPASRAAHRGSPRSVLMRGRCCAPAGPRILSVSELAQLLRSALDTGSVRCGWRARYPTQAAGFGAPVLHAEGRPDQLAAVMFRSAAQVLVFQPADGMDVVVRARADLYPARGALQLYVEAMEPRGLGALTLAFEQLKARLGAEGSSPRRASGRCRAGRARRYRDALHGAAIHDMRTVLGRRWPRRRS